MPNPLEKHKLREDLAERNGHAAHLFSGLLSFPLEYQGLYLSSDEGGWEIEKHELLLLTSESLMLAVVEVNEPEWVDAENVGLSCRHQGITRRLTSVPISQMRALEMTEQEQLRAGGESGPLVERTYRLILKEPLGHLGTDITLPLRKKGKYMRDTHTPAGDLEHFFTLLLARQRG